MRKLTVFSALALLASLTAFTFVPSPAPGPGAIEDMLVTFFKAFDAGDRATAHACTVPKDGHFPVLIYDMDLENKPVTVEGSEATKQYLEGLFDGVAKAKAKVVSKITRIHADCHSAQLGYATLEFTQAVTSGEKTEATGYRATALVSYDTKDQRWRIFHFHASLAPVLPAK